MKTLIPLVLLAACAKQSEPVTLVETVAVVDTTPDPVDPTPPAPEPNEEPPPAEPAVLQMVLFELDSARLTAQAEAVLEENLAILREHPQLEVEIQGHADERGTDAYNKRLGERRARTVRRFLTRHGIEDDRLRVVSYGESDPRLEQDTLRAYAVNRRCEFRVVQPPIEGMVVGSVTR